jgi:hypothetical protein
MKEINAKVRVFTSKKAKYTVLSLPVDSLPRSKKLRILASIRGRRFDAKAYSFSNWCMCHLPKEAATELKLKNNEKVKLRLVRILVK